MRPKALDAGGTLFAQLELAVALDVGRGQAQKTLTCAGGELFREFMVLAARASRCT